MDNATKKRIVKALLTRKDLRTPEQQELVALVKAEEPPEPAQEPEVAPAPLLTAIESVLTFALAVMLTPVIVRAISGGGIKELDRAVVIVLPAAFVGAAAIAGMGFWCIRRLFEDNYPVRLAVCAVAAIVVVSIYMSPSKPESEATSPPASPAAVVVKAPTQAPELKLSTELAAKYPRPLYGPSALHIAAIEGDLQKIETLLAEGADLEARNRAQETPLMFAVDRAAKEPGHLEVVRYLLKQGAAANAQDQEGKTALQRAGGIRPLVELLAEYGADPNRNGDALWRTLRGDTHDIIAIADKFPTIGLPVDMEGRRWPGPLHHYASEHDAALVKYFLGRGLSAREADYRGYTPLHSALEHYLGDGADVVDVVPVLELLLTAGADVNARTAAGMSAMMMTRSPEIVRYLIGKGADVNAIVVWAPGSEQSVLDLYEYDKSSAGAAVLRAAGAKTAAELKREGVRAEH